MFKDLVTCKKKKITFNIISKESNIFNHNEQSFRPGIKKAPIMLVWHLSQHIYTNIFKQWEIKIQITNILHRKVQVQNVTISSVILVTFEKFKTLQTIITDAYY